MKKSDNKVINLFEQSSIGTKALVITESLKKNEPLESVFKTL